MDSGEKLLKTTAKPRGRGEIMKQRIDVSQLQELNPEQQDRLREWWRPEKYHLFVVGKGKSVYTVKSFKGDKICDGERVNRKRDGYYNDLSKQASYKYKANCLPLLSIGQCIELLAEKDMIHLESVFAKVSHGILSPDEILDALFEALKSVL